MLGHWLYRRWFHCQRKKQSAKAILHACGIPEGVLRAEWANQLNEQTKPAPRKYFDISSCPDEAIDGALLGRAQNKGRRVIEAILALEKTLTVHDENIRILESRLLTQSLHEAFSTLDIPAQLDDLRAQRSRVTQALIHKKAAVGIEVRNLLADISTNDYLRLRMNARALKQRIRDRLRQRKFELERLERAYRVTVNGKATIRYCTTNTNNISHTREQLAYSHRIRG